MGGDGGDLFTQVPIQRGQEETDHWGDASLVAKTHVQRGTTVRF